MNLKNLQDEDLRARTAKLVQQEREVLTAILHHLREIERRRLFSKLKFTSLFDYAVKELKYSEAQAQRRISAMRLICEIPALEQKVASGALSLTNMALAQTLFSKEKKAGRPFQSRGKIEVLKQLENKSTRAAQEIVFEISPEMKKRTSLDFQSIEDVELREKLLRLKGLMAHSDPGLDLNQLLHRLCDQALASHNKIKSPLRPSAPKVNSNASLAETRREVYRRDGGKCRNCASTYALEIDHIHPQALGGSSTLENMRLLCRPCNQRAAIDAFGQRKMSKYLRSPVVQYYSPSAHGTHFT